MSATATTATGLPATPPAGLSNARRVLRYALTAHRRALAAAVVCTMIHQACEAGVPILIGVAVDRALTDRSGAGLLGSLAALAALFGVLTVAMRASIRSVRRAAQGAAHDLRVLLTARVLDARGIAATHARAGVLLSTATSDALRVGMVDAAVWATCGAAAALAVSAVVLLRASLVLGLLVLIGLIPVFLLTRLAGRTLHRRSGAEQATAAQAAGLATDLVTGLRVLKGLGAEPAAADRYRRASQQSRAAAVRAATVLAVRTGLITVLIGAFVAVVALVGGRLAAEGTISVGQFVSAIGLTQFLIGPFTRLATAGAVFTRASASAHRIAAVLAAPPAVAGGATPLPRPAGELVLRAVRRGPLGGLTARIAAGECVGVVTADPAVAAALLDCLAREADPDAGCVELDGVPLTEVDVAAARAAVLVAAHDAVLFAGTLADNIAARADPARLDAAIHAADADQVAATVPGGMAAPVSERGRSLSGGQHQRVALARALAADPPVLVLHEPTTAVDAVTEARIAERIRALRRDRTTVLVTTSPALLAVTDRVLVLGDAGTLAADGRHADLVRTDADYREVVLA